MYAISTLNSGYSSYQSPLAGRIQTTEALSKTKADITANIRMEKNVVSVTLTMAWLLVPDGLFLVF